MMALPPWIGRLVALALVPVLLFVLYGFVIAPVLAAYAETDTRTQQVREQLAQFEAVAGTSAAYEAQLVELDRRLAAQSFTLDGETDAIAAAKLQDRVGSVITATGGVLRANQVLAATDDGAFRKIGVRVQANLRIGQLARAIYQLEAGRPFVFLDGVEIKARVNRRRNNEASDTDPELLVRFDAYSYLQGEGGQ